MEVVDKSQFFLKKVIYRLPSKQKPTKKNGVVVKFSPKGGVFGMFSKTKYFEVFNNEDSRHYAEYRQDIILDDFDKDIKIPLIVEYRLSCPKGNEKRVVNFLGEMETPESTLADFIDKLIGNFFEQNGREFLNDFSDSLSKLSILVESSVREESGLDFSLKLYVDGKDHISDILTKDTIAITPKDIDKSINIDIEYKLKVSNSQLVALHVYNNMDIKIIKQQVADAIVNYLEEIDTQKLFFNFINKDTKIKTMVEVINRDLLPFGRVIEIENIKIQNIKLEKFQEVDVEIVREPIDRTSQNIMIKNRLQFELEDAGKYIDKEMPSLQEWVKKELDRLFSSKLFGWEYIDFLVGFENIKTSIESEMRRKASEVGYRINQIISEPHLPENALLRMDTYNFNYTNLSTVDSGISADFNITVTFMLNDKEAFRELFKYAHNVNESLNKIFEVELKKVLSYESPERIFLHYYNDKFQGAKQSLKKELEEKISLYLMQRLNATIQDINIVPVDNGLLEPLYKVRGESRDIKIEVAPKIGGNPIVYKATLFVEGHDNNNWSQLIDGKYTMDKIEDLVVRTIQARFNVISEEELKFTTLEHRQAIEKIADALAKEAITKRYGLIVEISNLNRDRNREETLLLESGNKELAYIHKEKELNLELLAQRNRQDREDWLSLSNAIDEESKKEMADYEARLGVKQVPIVDSTLSDNTQTSSGLLKLAKDTDSLGLLQNNKLLGDLDDEDSE